jgi:hypothetical protein
MPKYQGYKKWVNLKPKQYYIGNEIQAESIFPMKNIEIRAKTPEAAAHKSRFRLINYGFPEHLDELKIENTRTIKTSHENSRPSRN